MILPGRLGAPLAVLAAAILGCAELGTDPQVPVALEFEGIAYPALIGGDTLRDADGLAAPLRATAYNGDGDTIAGAPFTFVALDTGVTVSPDGFLLATRRDGIVRILASAAGLQSLPRQVQVTRRPDSLAATGAAEQDFAYAIPDNAQNLAPELRVTVLSDDVAGGVSPNVAGWLVRWRVVHDGDTLAPGDTQFVALYEGSRHQLLDTSGTDGASARRLRVFANRLTVLADSFIVVAEARRHGTQLRGSPRRFVIHVAPQQ